MNISVLIPTYCRVNDLDRCLNGIYSQTIKPAEVIVVVREDDHETLQYMEGLIPSDINLKVALIAIPGVVQALNRGLQEVSGDVVAITDDDSEPYVHWLERLKLTFEQNPEVVGVGGRDWIHQDGSIIDQEADIVGKIQWFGRKIGNHHLGNGRAREVDFLKGVNCAYRTVPLQEIGFDQRLLGNGAQVHWELGIGLALKRKGWKLIYNPAIGVGHYPSQRFDEDQRNEFNRLAIRNAIHNETMIMLEHLPFFNRAIFICWALLIGTMSSPGLLQLFRVVMKRDAKAGTRFHAVMEGRFMGYKSWIKYQKLAGGPHR
ncbi:MAG: glycosyltransferase family 2 protein [Candidatus Cohnella colombiensis]|uniref:Glycosyltransferase family 2 protein n=1 Tax=Candidatus Cohnella colombiensis TaxID=3121368 RepID=A0AA95EXL8_9BACL|nr:MAG: glycosyltransferase family 2 protein [Cohnella sp.]